MGDVVLEGPDHPAIVTSSFKNRLGWQIRARYVWQQPYEAPWLLGSFHPDHKIDRALPGEY